MLAVSFSLGLAALGVALTTSLSAYLEASVDRERRILTQMRLETLVFRRLGQLGAGEAHPIAPSETQDGTASVWISMPEGKLDLNADRMEMLRPALDRLGLPNGLTDAPPRADGLSQRAARLALTSDQEDCLRRHVTLGRAPEPLEPLAAMGASTQLTRSVAPGDQVDVRVALPRAAGASDVLWVRARYTGEPRRPWKLHDHRRLTVKRGAVCGPGA